MQASRDPTGNPESSHFKFLDFLFQAVTFFFFFFFCQKLIIQVCQYPLQFKFDSSENRDEKVVFNVPQQILLKH